MATFDFQTVLVWTTNPGGVVRLLRNGAVTVYNAATDAVLFNLTSDSAGLVSFTTTDVPTVYLKTTGWTSEHITAASAVEAAAAAGVSNDAGIKTAIANPTSQSGSYLNFTYDLLLVGGKKTVRKDELALNAKDWGATGDGVTDDTTALQTWVTYLTTNGRRGFLPAGNYKITAPLNFSRRPGWEIHGAGRGATTITQATDNVAILNLGSDTASTMHTWGIDGVYLTYTNIQPSTNTAATPILFSGEGNQGYLRNVTFVRGYYGIKVASGIGCPWGCDWNDLSFGGELSGGAIDFSAGINGVPNNTWGRMFVTATAMTNTIFLVRGYNMTVGSIEIISNVNGRQLWQQNAGGKVEIGAIKCEVATFTGTGVRLIEALNAAYISIGHFTLGGTTFAITAGSTYALFAAVSSKIECGCIDTTVTNLTGGSFFVADASGTPTGIVEIGKRITSGTAPTGLTNIGGATGANGTLVRDYANQRLSDNKGDADTTVALGDPTTIAYSTALTAQRAVNLPSVNGELFNGLRYRVLTNGAVNGANTLLVKCSTTTLATLAVDKKWVEFTYRRNPANAAGGWVCTGYGDLP